MGIGHVLCVSIERKVYQIMKLSKAPAYNISEGNELWLPNINIPESIHWDGIDANFNNHPVFSCNFGYLRECDSIYTTVYQISSMILDHW